MADDALREIDEGAGHGEARAPRLRRLGREQVGLAALDPPDDRLRRHARLGEIARGVAPAFEIVLGRQE